MKNAYHELSDHFKKIGDLRHVYAIGSWDEASMMPSGGGAARGEALATLRVVIHDELAAKKVGNWLDACSNLALDEWQSANVREIRREHNEATCLPGDFVRAQAVAASRCEQAWRTCRAANDWVGMQPLLTEVVKLAREEAAIRAQQTGLTRYDALLDTYEPGCRSEMLDQVFRPLKEFLPKFTDEIVAAQARTPLLPLGDNFSIDKQRELGVDVMSVLGFDFEHGRLDISHHPFCGGVQEDVRITTRYTTENFVESLMAVIHETGHAMYEQGRPRNLPGQPVTAARSSGVHESQSLLMEMQACRSPEFIAFLAPKIRQTFGAADSDPAWTDANLQRLYTQVKRDFIRVDADETTYPMHVILRYELERAMIEEQLEVSDLPSAWNEKMMEFLGLDTTDNFKDGCLQDVHWPASLFGYFPTYTLGALMAAQMFAAAKQTMPELLGNLSQGDFTRLLTWLRENVHSLGSLKPVDDLLVHATGEKLDPQFFISHLLARYRTSG